MWNMSPGLGGQVYIMASYCAEMEKGHNCAHVLLGDMLCLLKRAVFTVFFISDLKKMHISGASDQM